jgi:two-component system NtrC family response regulator
MGFSFLMQKKRILVVDDDEAILDSLKGYLVLKGYDVDTAKTAKEAMRKSEAHFYNLAILDIRLPDANGTDLLTKMRKNRPEMVKIMLTGYPDQANTMNSLNKGANGYLLKPVELDKLLKIVEKKIEEQEQAKKMDQEKVTEFIVSWGREKDETR